MFLAQDIVTPAEKALEAALSANINNLVLVILLVGGIAFVLLIWVFSRTIKNAAAAGQSAQDFNSAVLEFSGKSNDRLADSISQLSETLKNMGQAQAAVLSEVNNLSTTQAHDTGEVQDRLRSIKTQLDAMETELAAIRVGVDSMIERKAGA